jgi:uncharacterized protein YbjT (DUF2867 family)
LEVCHAESILVVGATGTVGSRLVARLAASGRRVKALVRTEQRAAAVGHVATPVVGELSEPQTLARAFEGAERVFVLAPPVPGVEVLERNAFGAAIGAGAERIVYLSNYGAGDFSHDDLHFTAHAANERLLASLGVEWTVLRPTRFMTHMPYIWSSVVRRGILLEAGGDGAMTVIDPDDVAEVAFLALTADGHEGQRYDLTSDDSFTAAELAATLSRRIGRDLAVFSGDTEALRAALLESGARSEYAPLMAAYFATVTAGHWHVTETAGELLGRQPRAYAEWLDANLPAILESASAS